MTDVRHQLIMLRPMQAGASGYARLQRDSVETLIQINARGLHTPAITAYGYAGQGLAHELGGARVNPHGEVFLSSQTPRGRTEPKSMLALLILDDDGKPLLIGLCTKETNLLDAKNAMLALSDRLTRAAREAERLRLEAPETPRLSEAPPRLSPMEADSGEVILTEADQADAVTAKSEGVPAPQIKRMIIHQKHRKRNEPAREVFLPAIDPSLYIAAYEKRTETAPSPPSVPKPSTLSKLPPETEVSAITGTPSLQAFPKVQKAAPLIPRKRAAPSVDRLRPVLWPSAFASIKPWFDVCLPTRLFELPGWRFVRASRGDLWIGCLRQNGRVIRVAYAFPGEQPPEKSRPYHALRGTDGKTYQVLWQNTT